MRDYESETKKRVAWIQNLLKSSGAKGIVFGNSGGKDSALVGILCGLASENILGVLMPCGSKQNYGRDTDDAHRLGSAFNIKNITIDLTETKNILSSELGSAMKISDAAERNINPRLRMTTLYALGQSLGYLVAGTGNKSEYFMGYFTKWGDGGYDFNPIADLTATEVFEFLRHLNAPTEIVDKAPSAGLFDGQTDESEMGVSYAAIDEYINTQTYGDAAAVEKIRRAHNSTAHKRRMPLIYEE